MTLPAREVTLDARARAPLDPPAVCMPALAVRPRSCSVPARARCCVGARAHRSGGGGSGVVPAPPSPPLSFSGPLCAARLNLASVVRAAPRIILTQPDGLWNTHPRPAEHVRDKPKCPEVCGRCSMAKERAGPQRAREGTTQRPQALEHLADQTGQTARPQPCREQQLRLEKPLEWGKEESLSACSRLPAGHARSSAALLKTRPSRWCLGPVRHGPRAKLSVVPRQPITCPHQPSPRRLASPRCPARATQRNPQAQPLMTSTPHSKRDCTASEGSTRANCHRNSTTPPRPQPKPFPKTKQAPERRRRKRVPPTPTRTHTHTTE